MLKTALAGADVLNSGTIQADGGRVGLIAANKVLVDVERLCNAHIPQWLVTPGMGEAKIASFYSDEEKVANDAWCRNKAFQLRSFCTDPSLPWVAARWAKFAMHAAKGALRSVTSPVSSSYNSVEEDAQEEARKWVQSTSARG